MKRIPAILLTAVLGLPVQAETASVTVTQDDCRHITVHTPDASVAYTPGSTADGRSVVPADLGGGYRVKPPETYSMDINIDLQERFGLPANKGQYMGEIRAGKVEIKDGRAFYNGQELATGAQNAIAEACAKLQKK
tara:strand:- start:3494 stop:3901 length:408 start_codon:yes stop_codon:yes gene_type:complete